MRIICGTILVGCAVFSIAAFAGTSCKDGVAKAVAVERAPVIDGDLSDWDCSAPVLCWNAEERAEEENATLFFLYDETNLYAACNMTLADGRMSENRNRPQDRYWLGDILQLRLCTDKSLGWPLPNRDNPRYKGNPRLTCVNLWRDTAAGVDYCHITPGAIFDCPAATNPEGSAITTVSAPGRFMLEARVPWSALGVPDGKCPFAPGERMPAVADIKWSPGTDGHSTAAIYARDPGTFAFRNIDTWGRIEFARPGAAQTRKEEGRRTKDELRRRYAEIAAAARGATGPDMSDWAPIAFDLPKRAKVSVNVFDGNGGVIREIVGGEWRNAGRVEVRWDGRDALGFPCETGRDYRWGVYAHDGLDVVYQGTVGVSGEPPYKTTDGTGGWGADHGPPVACAADDTGRYFVWHMSEQGCALVKTDFDGKVLWRSNPFVRGGWGEYTAACAVDGVLWLVHGAVNGKAKSALVKVDGATGRHMLFPDGRAFVELPVSATATNVPPHSAVRPEFCFNCAGIAVKGGNVFVSDRNGNRILVVDAARGEISDEMPCESPRGLAFMPDRALWAVSGKHMVRFDGERRSSIAGESLVNPYALAIGPDGTVYVSDLGDSQQVKVFVGDTGRDVPTARPLSTGSWSRPYLLSRTFGKAGGRGFLGKIDYDAFLYPFGIAIDKTGALLVAEASAPKIVSVLDAGTGAVRRRYFGYTAYSPSNIPDCDDPLVEYCSVNIGQACGNSAFLRQRIGDEPDACWDYPGAGLGEFGSILSTMNMPEILRCTNGLKYLAPDGTPNHRDSERPMVVCRVDGDDIRPVAGIFFDPPAKRGGPSSSFRLWTDADGDGRRQPGEFAAVTNVAGRIWNWSFVTGAVRMEPNGDLFLTTMDNAVICFPCRGFNGCGAPLWEAAEAYVAIPEIIVGKSALYHTWRSGLLGLRRDSAGNFYAAVDCNLDYASLELTKAMKLGMGHSSEYNGIFICKYAPDGSPVWRVGRKATGGLKPGEMLHHWVFAGMVGDDYAVAASEWGTFTVYTADGFFVDTLFDAPGLPGRGQPYTFSGEDFSGRIAAFPGRGEVWAYNAGQSFKVKGFELFTNDNCHNCSQIANANNPVNPVNPVKNFFKVSGEWRTNGVVRLERVAPLFVPGAKPKPIEKAKIERVGGKVVFTAHVVDDTPLVNVAPDASAVFKGGDAVGFEIGPGRTFSRKERKGHKETFARILAARIGGVDRVIAMQQGGTRLSRPQEYTTPAGGTAAFSFVGDAPGAAVAFSQTADGYDVRIEVPETLFELDFSQPVFWDAEALFSGDGGRGVGTMKRVYLYNEEKSQTSMVDDTPTEARLHPEGYVEVTL